MIKVINTLTKRIEALNTEFKKQEQISNEPEMLCDYEFALNTMANIELEILQLSKAIEIINNYEQVKKLTIPVVGNQREMFKCFVDDFYKWHKTTDYLTVKKEDWQEYIIKTT